MSLFAHAWYVDCSMLQAIIHVIDTVLLPPKPSKSEL
jgi:uncharacterized surface protein with fasciclin (FAS1) repeats